jgi:hypothetical protein
MPHRRQRSWPAGSRGHNEERVFAPHGAEPGGFEPLRDRRFLGQNEAKQRRAAHGRPAFIQRPPQEKKQVRQDADKSPVTEN